MADLLDSLLPADYDAPDVQSVLGGEQGFICFPTGSGPTLCSAPCLPVGIGP